MLSTILGTKEHMAQTFLKDGRRIPVTIVKAGPCLVTEVKTVTRDGYTAIQVGLGERKRVSNAVLGQLKKKGIKSIPRFLRELKVEAGEDLNVGDTITVDKLFKPGDFVNVTGQSHGKGFTGVVKRWGFKGGPRTHGQSDRERAPGSIGQTTTPGRVYKGKKMAGRAGNETVTIRNLMVVKVELQGELWLKGQVPGRRKGLLIIKKVGESKKFPGLEEENNHLEKKEEEEKKTEKAVKGEQKADASESR